MNAHDPNPNGRGTWKCPICKTQPCKCPPDGSR